LLLIFHFSPRHVQKQSSSVHNENVNKQQALSSALIKLTALNGTAGTAHKLSRVHQCSRVMVNAIVSVNARHTRMFTVILCSFLYFNIAVTAEPLQGMNSPGGTEENHENTSVRKAGLITTTS
jgi:hypothetical protein